MVTNLLVQTPANESVDGTFPFLKRHMINDRFRSLGCPPPLLVSSIKIRGLKGASLPTWVYHDELSQYWHWTAGLSCELWWFRTYQSQWLCSSLNRGNLWQHTALMQPACCWVLHGGCPPGSLAARCDLCRRPYLDVPPTLVVDTPGWCHPRSLLRPHLQVPGPKQQLLMVQDVKYWQWWEEASNGCASSTRLTMTQPERTNRHELLGIVWVSWITVNGSQQLQTN